MTNELEMHSVRHEAMTPAVAYLRVSGKSQLDTDGFPRQRAAIEVYASAHRFEIIRTYEERAVSGTTEWEERPAWSQMIASLNGVRTIVIEKLDRLARELFIQEYILRDLKKRGVTLISVAEEDIDSSPERIMFRQIMGALHQYDKTMIVSKLRAARQRVKAATGRCEGVKPYGVFPGEQEILDWMRGERQKGRSFYGIAQALYGRDIKARKGGYWSGRMVGNILNRDKKIPSRSGLRIPADPLRHI